MMSIYPVSIVMLTHNGAEFSRHTFQSILEAEARPSEIFIVDNCSDDNTPELIQEFVPRFQQHGIKVTTWRNNENVGCSLARNQAWEKATMPYTVFLDNDAPVRTSNWLKLFIDEFKKRPKLGIIGPKIVYPYQPHKIQCAGVGINRMSRIAFMGRGADLNAPEFAEYRTVKALISACWMMRTDLRDSIGMLDELFHPVQYEDIDLCVRAWLAGWEVGYTPNVQMYHFEGITTASFGQDVYQSNIARNFQKFHARYHALFKKQFDELPPEYLHWLTRSELGLRPELDLAMI